MRRILLTFAFIAGAGAAGAQTAHAPAAGAPDTRMNTQMNSGANVSGSAGADTATAPMPMTGAAATAQKRIEMDGYTNVTGLAKGSDGLWRGTAMRGNTEVQVTVDRAGKVAAQ